MHIRRASRETYTDLVDLACARVPALDPAELSPVLLSEGFVRVDAVLVAVEEDEVLGWGVLHDAYGSTDAVIASVFVRRKHEGRGVGTRLHDGLLAHAPPGTTSVRGVAFDDEDRPLEVAMAWGYAVQQHSIRSTLDLRGLSTQVRLPAGVTLEDASSLQFADPDAVAAMLDRSQTNPERAHGLVIDVAKLRSWLSPTEQPMAVLARVEGEPAAITFGMCGGDVVYVAYTGVDPSRRGRGLGRLVKEELHRMAAAQGVRRAVTANESGNTGIRRLNVELGYVPGVGEYRLERQGRATLGG